MTFFSVTAAQKKSHPVPPVSPIDSCGVCCLRQDGIMSNCIVCGKMVHSKVQCSLPDPASIVGGKTNEAVRFCRKCQCIRCKLPQRQSHVCICVSCSTPTSDVATCKSCLQPIHIQDCAIETDNGSFTCVKCLERQGKYVLSSLLPFLSTYLILR